MNKKIIVVIAIIFLLALFAYAKLLHKNAGTDIPDDEKNYTYSGPNGNLSNVKVAVLYEKVTDRAINGGRSLEETVRILKATRADMIFRAFWIWNFPIPDSPDNIPPEIANLAAERLNVKPENVPKLVRETGFSYEALSDSISAIKKEMPGVIVVGAIPAQTVGRMDMNPITGKVLTNEETWAMAFDPEKWALNYTYEGSLLAKEKFQELKSANDQTTFKNGYDYRLANGYFPDITNPDFQELFLSRAQKQIDSGADAIWVDMLYAQTQLVYGATKDANHPAVKESYEAASKLVDKIHEYGASKGKTIYVGTWSEPVINYPGAAPKLDFATTTPMPEEIKNGKFDDARWARINLGIKTKFGNIPHFAFIDWGGMPNAAIDVFSQQLNKEQQKSFLKTADAYFQSKGITFIYPVHGGDFWGSPKVRAFGKFTKYYSLAPEFSTYETIKELAINNAQR